MIRSVFARTMLQRLPTQLLSGSIRSSVSARMAGSVAPAPISPLGKELRALMRRVPFPVVVVTTEPSSNDPNEAAGHRGITCSSFTSVSLSPAIVSFSIRVPSQTSAILKRSNNFVVNVLSKEQVSHALTFSSPSTQSDFAPFPHYFESDRNLILMGCLGSLVCKSFTSQVVGDHEVWYGEVVKVIPGVGGVRDLDCKGDPLLHYEGSFRSVGDEVFMRAFEEGWLSFNEWTHRAHLRMAWIYLQEAESKNDAYPLIREGIQKYNAANQHLITHGYNDTITQFYVDMLHLIISAERTQDDGQSRSATTRATQEDFLDFLKRYPFLEDQGYIGRFYSKEHIRSAKAKRR
ncbi:flavin reductase like domain-containing protein [Polychytrium aggregatum]|uniref:flavin reductase like domain-containing protein n=1 Tax=Polychytrium aggregatum TaxID=110093 RepID=UPI0022FDF4A8|nr:flavin reductase like domain-containing protein [Polychytrium aggregatum]KAI9202690.1 flavin reductase like domain-containing protein [Polychytrium aggregatum]